MNTIINLYNTAIDSFIEVFVFILTFLLKVSIFLYVMSIKRKKSKFFRKAIIAGILAFCFSLMIKEWKKKSRYDSQY